MNPVVWGPALWQALLSCAWHAIGRDDAVGSVLRTLLLDHLPFLLPCEKCRNHFAKKLGRVNTRAKGEPCTGERALTWLWYLKDEVNRSLGRTSVPLHDVRTRLDFHKAPVDDVALADALVLVARAAHANRRDDLFVDFARTLTALLPLPSDSELRGHLGAMQRPVVTNAVRAARAARIERGLPVLALPHYRTVDSSS